MPLRSTGIALVGAMIALGACAGSNAADDHADASVEATPDASGTGSWSADPACVAAADAIYTAGPVAGPRGSIVACALGDRMEQAEVQGELGAGGAGGVVALTGARVVKLAYRTVRSDGTPTISTATAYLPLVPRSMPAPVVLIGRSTAGLADRCAPSKDPHPVRTLAMPFAARGFIAIIPDFAGLGTSGVHAYLDNHEQAAELFDGVLALRALVPGNVVGDAVAAVGYSQGGGSVLSAQALEHELTGARTLRGVAAIAPEWPISTRSFGYEDVLRNPDSLTALAGLASPAVTVMRHYGYFANRGGTAAAGAAFPAGERASIISALESLCTLQVGGSLNAQQPRLRDLVDATFRDQVLACIDGAPGCTGTGASFHQWLTADLVTADPAGARVLIVQGLLDQVMPAAGEAACDAAKLRAEGVEPTIYGDAAATHDTVLERRIEDTVAWIEAVATGAAAPGFDSAPLPACAR